MFGGICQMCTGFDDSRLSIFCIPLSSMASFKKSPLGRKSQTQIRSPTIKRCHSSPVTLQGWLHKQGSDGLMLWKKRWFVLSDYCLFYYKGPEEEKLLGSFLLASYKISPCSAQDNVNRKFAFKAEHANMRTYYFSAESQAAMSQWMIALSLASVLQEGQGLDCLPHNELPQLTSNPARFGNDMDLSNAALDNMWYGTSVGLIPQPVYANAPPKPRRLTETSPDSSLDRPIIHSDPMSKVAQPQQIPSKSINYHRPLVHLPNIMLSDSSNKNLSPYPHEMDPQYNSVKFSYQKPAQFYEDVYKENLPHSQAHLHSYPKVNFPPRPHSADFLEHELQSSRDKRSYPGGGGRGMQAQRPKSSLDMRCVEASLDSIHWSEEGYAKKMRESSVYLTPQLHHTLNSRVSTPTIKPNYMKHADLMAGLEDTSPASVVMRNHSAAIHHQEKRWSEYLNTVDTSSPFMRSASARISRPKAEDETSESSLTTLSNTAKYPEDPRKVQQREESMKRLLEWKQRMLQSPLTKKSCTYSNYTIRGEPVCSSKLSDDYSAHETSLSVKTVNGLDVRKSVTKSSVGGNSISASASDVSESRVKGSRRRGDDTGLRRSKHHELASSSASVPVPPYSYSSDEESPDKSDSEARKRLRKPSTNARSRSQLSDRIVIVATPDYENIKSIGVKNQLPDESNKYDKDYVKLRKTSNTRDEKVNNKHGDSGYSTLRNGLKPNETPHTPMSPTKLMVDEELGLKLDESRLIKEFSYQYIKCDESEDGISSNSEKPPLSVHNRISLFEPGKSKGVGNQPRFSPARSSPSGRFSEPHHSRQSSVQDDAQMDEKPDNARSPVPVQHYQLDEEESDREDLRPSDGEPDEEVQIVLAQQKVIDKVAKSRPKSSPVQLAEAQVALRKTPVEINISSPNLLSSSQDDLDFEINFNMLEEHYMPMTPKKTVLSPTQELISSPSNSAVIDELRTEDENPYVEMAQNGNSSTTYMATSLGAAYLSGAVESGKSVKESSPRYCDMNKDAHYELIDKVGQEPVYVEVNPYVAEGKKKGKKSSEINEVGSQNLSHEVRAEYVCQDTCSLPDILNSSSASVNPGSVKSDSSDADDEASKDLDSIDAPRHPRFSLSDTFRPASYYLGACTGKLISEVEPAALINLHTEHHDSSDSDLVSPPPIPTSPPPIDELETSLESTINLKAQTKDSDRCWAKSPTISDVDLEKVALQTALSKSVDYLSSETESIESVKRESVLKRRPVSINLLESFGETHMSVSSPSNCSRKSRSSDLESVGSRNGIVLCDDETEYKVSMSQLSASGDRGHSDYGRLVQADLYQWDNYVSERNYQQLPKLQGSMMYENVNGSRLVNNCTYGSSLGLREEHPPSPAPDTPPRPPPPDQPTSSQQTVAPYYYSDLLKSDGFNSAHAKKNLMSSARRSSRIKTLNNQRQSNDLVTKRNDIGRKINQIQPNHNLHPPPAVDQVTDLANEIRAASELLRAKDRGQLDERNLYVSGNQMVHKPTGHNFVMRSQTPDARRDKINFFPQAIPSKHNKACSSSSGLPKRRSRSLEGLLDDMDEYPAEPRQHKLSPGNAISRLLLTSQPTRSKAEPERSTTSQQDGWSTCTLTPTPDPQVEEVWEEDALWRENLRKVSIRHTRSLDDLDKGPSLPKPTSRTHRHSDYTEQGPINQDDQLDDGVHYERLVRNKETLEQIRQTQTYKDGIVWEDKPAQKPDHIPNVPNVIAQLNNKSLFEIDREKLRQWDLMSSAPAGMVARNAQKATDSHTLPSTGSALLSKEPLGSSTLPKPQDSSTVDLIPTNSQVPIKKNTPWNINMSAGELLGRTHEELVLLLIQLRRQSAGVCKSMENCHKEIEHQARLVQGDPSKKIEHLQHLEELKQHLIELEKQYEKGKPLVNLVDNMVKLGSLYRVGTDQEPAPQKLEFNYKVQEQRVLAEERRDWERISPDHNQLQAKVEKLYKLDRLLQEESDILQGLQQDKEVLERALGGLKHKLQSIHGNPAITERYRRQQKMLEKELTRVRSILAQNSKKLEETVAENARLEQELVILRQKLLCSRRPSEPGVASATALEAELHRVQLLVGDLQQQRQELSLQVRQLTEKSNSLSQQIRPGPTGIAGAGAVPSKKKSTSSWVETDLDSQLTQDVRVETPTSPPKPSVDTFPPLYVNTDTNNKRVVAKEKVQEIKTVRIVKRESERRQRDRDKNGSLGIPLNQIPRKGIIAEEPSLEITEVSKSNNGKFPEEICDPPPAPSPRSDSLTVYKDMLSRQVILKDELDPGKVLMCADLFAHSEGSPQLSPVYLSEAAREIVEEVAWRASGCRRLVPREKRRHHTISGQSFVKSPSTCSVGGSKDDLDMERALKPRMSTPDVVRSTLSRMDCKFTAEAIDKLLGTPCKIVIPERYIPESGPNLSEEEQQKRTKKADSIRRMLTETASQVVPPPEPAEQDPSGTLKKKVAEEKRQREYLLQLNHILAQQVMEKSKIVAVAAMTQIQLEPIQVEEEADLSPVEPLPLYQQRELYYS